MPRGRPKTAVGTTNDNPLMVSATDLDRAKAKVADLRQKVEQATAEWEHAQDELKRKAKQFLAEYGLSDLFANTGRPTKTASSRDGKAKGERWRLSHILALIDENQNGLSETDLRSKMTRRKPTAKQDKVAGYLAEYTTEKSGRYSLNAKGKAELKS